MKKLLSVLLCSLMALSLTGCGSSGTSDDTFVFASELDVQTLDTTVSDDGMSFNAMHACIDGLMGLDKDGKIINAIADKVDTSADGLTYTYTLKKDAKWSNGDAVTADDFVYAWQRIIKNAGNYAYMFGSDGANIKGADELMAKQAGDEDAGVAGQDLTQADLDTLGVKQGADEKTLVVTLASPCSYFDELMTFPCYYPINRKFAEEKGDKYAKTADNVLSNGAYVLKSWTLGKKVTYEKNEDYYNAKAVKTKKLEILLVQEPKTAASNFDSGNSDFCTINSSLVDKYKKEKTYQTFNEGYLFYLSLNFKNKYLANANIRKALSLAIKRDDLTANVLKDGSKPATGFVPSQLSTDPSGKDFRDVAGSFEDLTYNKTKAQEYFDAGLKELGETSISIELLYGTDESPMDTLATYLQNSFKQIKGLTINMTATTKNDRIYTRQKNGDYDIACTRWGPDYGDPTTYLNLLLSDNSNNYGKYVNAAYDAKMKEVQTTTDTAARYTAMVAAEKIAMDDLAFIPIFEKGTAALQKENVSGLVHRPVGVPYTFAYVEKK